VGLSRFSLILGRWRGGGFDRAGFEGSAARRRVEGLDDLTFPCSFLDTGAFSQGVGGSSAVIDGFGRSAIGSLAGGFGSSSRWVAGSAIGRTKVAFCFFNLRHRVSAGGFWAFGVPWGCGDVDTDRVFAVGGWGFWA